MCVHSKHGFPNASYELLKPAFRLVVWKREHSRLLRFFTRTMIVPSSIVG